MIFGGATEAVVSRDRETCWCGHSQSKFHDVAGKREDELGIESERVVEPDLNVMDFVDNCPHKGNQQEPQSNGSEKHSERKRRNLSGRPKKSEG
jgi:hypothetical protein